MMDMGSPATKRGVTRAKDAERRREELQQPSSDVAADPGQPATRAHQPGQQSWSQGQLVGLVPGGLLLKDRRQGVAGCAGQRLDDGHRRDVDSVQIGVDALPQVRQTGVVVQTGDRPSRPVRMGEEQVGSDSPVVDHANENKTYLLSPG